MRVLRTVPFFLLAAFIVWLPAEDVAAQIKDDNEALKTLKVPEGFEIRLFAGGDVCHNPAAIDVDVYGRVWVCEGKNYRSTFAKAPTPKDPDADRIKVFEDTDGDGKADKVTVFADKIPIVPMTVCVEGDHCHVGVSPEWWRFDGASDRKNPVGKNKAVLLNGFRKGGGKAPNWVDHDHALHGITLGPDGRFYRLTMKGAPPPAKTAAPDRTTVPGLLSSLMSPVPAVRHLAVTALREKSKESLEPLAKLAREGKHPLERARALGVVRNDEPDACGQRKCG